MAYIMPRGGQPVDKSVFHLREDLLGIRVKNGVNQPLFGMSYPAKEPDADP